MIDLNSAPRCHIEPMIDKSNTIKAIVANRCEGTYKVVELDSLTEYVGKSAADETISYFNEHIGDWKYPSEFHPGECLGSNSGRDAFDILEGDYVDRIARVANRMSNYIQSHIYLIGDYDVALIVGFILSTYFMEMFNYAPRLLIRGATNSGKSTLLDILAELCYRGNLTGNTTEAALFRNIHNNQITPLLDEFQDYSTDARNGIKKVLKNGNTRGRSAQRVEKQSNNAMKAVSYDVFAPLALINQAGGKSIPEEVVNRSITITMFAQPDIEIPMGQDIDELREIRDELYTVKLMWIAESGRLPYQNIKKAAEVELQKKTGILIDGRAYHFSNRCRDIMGTMYTIAKMARIEEPIVKAFGGIQEAVIDDERDSQLGRVFMSILRCAEEFIGENPLFPRITDAIQNLSTSAIADKYRQLLVEEGELGTNEKCPTRSITNMLKEMGFNLTRDRNTNKSLISARGLESTFQFNLMKYGSEDAIDRYGAEKIKEMINKRKNDLPTEGAYSEQPNNLTTKKGD